VLKNKLTFKALLRLFALAVLVALLVFFGL